VKFPDPAQIPDLVDTLFPAMTAQQRTYFTRLGQAICHLGRMVTNQG